ncbi:MAG: hypothetical protein K5633_05835 [Paludibacteraceae bacterium]|nr:hypothetical protein [Paludibacteraceae bacterium]
MKEIGKRFLPHVVAIVTFFVLTLVYFSPVLDGKQLTGPDTESWEGMAQEMMAWDEAHPDDPTSWTDAMFGGMPTYQIGTHQKPDVVGAVANNTLYWMPTVVFTMFVYLFGAYLMLLCLGLNPWLSLAMSVGFCFCSYNYIILAVGHNTKALTIAWLPALVGSIAYTYRKNKWIGAILSTVFAALVIKSGHYQIVYYGLLMIGLLVVSEAVYAVKEKRVKGFLGASGLLLVAAVLATALDATTLLTTREYSEYTMRGKSNGLTEKVNTTGDMGERHGLDKDYITAWSYGKSETMTLLIPNAMGGGSVEPVVEEGEVWKQMRAQGYPAREIKKLQVPTYWGDQPFTSGPVYAGVIVFFLAVIGLMLVKARDRWWLVAALVLSLLLSWGRHFMPLTEFFIDYFPMYNMFRTVSMTLVITCLCLATLAALGMKEWFSQEVEEVKKKRALYVGLGVTAGVLVLGGLAFSLFADFASPNDPEWLASALSEDRRTMLWDDAIRSLVLTLFAFGALWFSLRKSPVGKGWIWAALGVLMLVDMAPVAKRYLNNEMFVSKRMKRHQPRPVDNYILSQDKMGDNPRVLDLTVNVFNSSAPAYYHHLVGGYHAAKLRRYQELIDSCLQPEIQYIGMQLSSPTSGMTMESFQEMMKNMQALNMMNTKWIVLNGENGVIENTQRNGAVWLVDSIVVAENADEEIGSIEKINTKTTVVMDKNEAERLGLKAGACGVADHSDRIVLREYRPNRLTYLYRGKEGRVAVFSEVFYDAGWNVYIDGAKAEYGRGDYLLRVMSLPSGSHTIEWRFEPESQAKGDLIRTVASVVLILGIVGAVAVVVVRRRKRQKKQEK